MAVEPASLLDAERRGLAEMEAKAKERFAALDAEDEARRQKKREEQRVRDEALRLREEQRRDRNDQLQQLAKVNPREAGRMIVARIRQMRDGGLPADKDDLDDLRALRQSKARAKGRLRAKQTRKLFKRAKALRDDAYEAESAAKHALQALMDDKERRRVDEELRLLELGLSPPKPKPRKKKMNLWRRVFGSRKKVVGGGV